MLTVQYACDTGKDFPSEEDFEQWVDAVFKQLATEMTALTIRVVDGEEIQALNRDFRGKDKPTNVLAFPFEEPDYLGDIAICAPVVAEEANEQNKTPKSHWAHMTVHAVLHLLGYDHKEDESAEEMEGLEREIMKKIGFEDPY
ncbi:MAG: hypothetical protein K0Q74_1140 [Gammaproteobacteria bacterium]|jgi:probable rRNA maturation factor|nr:hypothetical protein [Gammaproteobacteria bacterium]